MLAKETRQVLEMVREESSSGKYVLEAGIWILGLFRKTEWIGEIMEMGEWKESVNHIPFQSLVKYAFTNTK